MKIPRIAFCTPVNPAPTGISDYSEELLPYLAQYCDITLYLADGLKPTNPALSQHLDVRPMRRLERAHRRAPYDAIVYHMGNSPAHADIWRVAQRVPGVVVLHDFVLHHFMLWYAANVYHDVQRYVGDMRRYYGEAGDHVAQLMIRGHFTPAAFDFPCCEAVLSAARAVLSHNRYVQQQVAARAPALPNEIVPMGVPLPPLIPREAARARLGIAPDALVLASFGHINAYKRMEPALRALLELRRDYPTARYVLVGSVSPNYDVAGLVQRMGLSDAVQITGYVDRAMFEDYVAAADICINLRHPTSGETSASLLRLLGAGKPTLVSATGSYAELPPHVAAQVDLDASENELLVRYVRLLVERPEVAAALGANARAFVAHHHTLDLSAQRYARLLARWYAWPVVMRFREAPLWEVGTREGEERERRGEGAAERRGSEAAGTRGGEAAGTREGEAAATENAVLGEIAQQLVEIGVTEEDETVLRLVALHLAEVGGGIA